jgi:hypothetical protein
VERILFQELLAEGAVPRVAVFVDGLNEFAFGAPFPAERLRRAVNSPVVNALEVLRDALPGARLIARSKAAWRPRRSDAELLAAYDDPPLLERRIARCETNRRLITAVASFWHVRPLFVWQPVPTYHYDLRYHLFGDLDFGVNNCSAFGYARMADRLRHAPPASDFLWAADVQEGVRQPLYVDQVHYTAALSAVIGRVIGQALLERGYCVQPR